MRVCFQYNAFVFDQEEIERIWGHLLSILEQIVDDPHIAVKELVLLTSQEKAQILNEFNDTAADYPREKTIHQLFEEQVVRIAIGTAVYEGSRIDIPGAQREGESISTDFAGERRTNCGRVAIMAERSLEMMVGIYAILKAGGAYVPIDPDYPEERIRYMLEDAGATAGLAASLERACGFCRYGY